MGDVYRLVEELESRALFLKGHEGWDSMGLDGRELWKSGRRGDETRSPSLRLDLLSWVDETARRTGRPSKEGRGFR